MMAGRTVVIGAGVIGLLCAYELARRNEDVVVLDKGEPGAACSSGNAGLIVPCMASPIPSPGLIRTSLRWALRPDSALYVRPWSIPGLAGWLWRFRSYCNARAYEFGLDAVSRLAAGTMALFDELAGDIPFQMHQEGVLFVFLDEAALEEERELLTRMAPYGYQAPRILDAQELHDFQDGLTDRVTGGLLVSEERHMRPETLMQGLRQRLEGLGVPVHSGVEVLAGMHRRGRLTTVHTTQGRFGGDHFLLAAGAWTGLLARRLGGRVPVQAGKGYSVTVDSPAWQPMRPLYLGEAKIVCTPFAGAMRLAGTMELSGVNVRLERKRIESIRRAAGEFLRYGPTRSGTNEWVGMRALTPDGLPVIGRTRQMGNLLLATGHGILGVTLAPATARIIADLICDETPGMDLAPFSPDRFADGHRHSHEPPA